METFNAIFSNAFSLIISLAVYIYLAYCLMVIAGKLDVPNGWLAFIPVANVYLMCKIVGISGWYLLLAFAPIVGAFLIPLNATLGLIVYAAGFLVVLVFYVYLWWKIAEQRLRPGWYGILMLVPIANLIVPGVLAFREAHPMAGGPTPHTM